MQLLLSRGSLVPLQRHSVTGDSYTSSASGWGRHDWTLGQNWPPWSFCTMTGNPSLGATQNKLNSAFFAFYILSDIWWKLFFSPTFADSASWDNLKSSPPPLPNSFHFTDPLSVAPSHQWNSHVIVLKVESIATIAAVLPLLYFLLAD